MSGPDVIQLDGLGDLRRTHPCGHVRSADVGQEVVVSGWVHGRRDHGGVIFVDLRDASGLLQVVFRPDVDPDAHRRAHQLRSEFVLLVRGVVERRSEETVNTSLPTGELEVSVHELRLLNTAASPPFPIEEEVEADEPVRLRHRIHDLRRPPLQRSLRLRDAATRSVRGTLAELGFLDIETPVLAKATPEGARDFLVPSRMHPGQFYALPQSPQLLKQLLVIGGFERYYQIAHCFRDEDLRADRQFEFTQLDLEMAFVGVEDLLGVLEELTVRAFADVLGVEIPRPFQRLGHTEAMQRYGIDKPDTRVQLELVELTDVFAGSEFRAFRGAVDNGGIVKCLPVHEADALSRGDVDRLEAFVKKELGARGLAWVRVTGDGTWQSPIVKFFSETERQTIAERTGAKPGSLLLFQADTAARANAILARLRNDLGHRLGRVDGRPWDLLFVVDFPLFEREEDGTLSYAHMPFVAPIDEHLGKLESEPETVRGTHYDLILNGVELGSGSLRNHRSDVQRRILQVLGYAKDEMQERFGFLLDALDAGAPPHGGFAFGYDRLVLLMAGGDSLRDVIAFPKTQRGQDLLLDAPSEIAQPQLDELSLRVRRRTQS